MAVFNNDDNYLIADIILGIYCLALAILSLILNPLVFIFNRTKNTPTAQLFQILSICDFLAATFYPVAMATNFLSSNQENIINIYFLIFIYVMFILGNNTSSLLVSLMCIYRLLGIAFPFRRISRSLIHGIVSVILVYSVSVTATSVVLVDVFNPFWYQQRQTFDITMRYRDKEEVKPDQTVSSKLYMIPKLIFILSVTMNTIASITSAIVLMRVRNETGNSQSRATSRKGAITLLILNLGGAIVGIYDICISFTLVEGDLENLCTHSTPEKIAIIFSYPLGIVSLNAINPLLIYVRSLDMRTFANQQTKFILLRCSRKTY